MKHESSGSRCLRMILLLVAAVFLLSACDIINGFLGGGEADQPTTPAVRKGAPQKPDQPTKPAAGQPAAPAAEAEKELTIVEAFEKELNTRLAAYSFVPSGRIDPFRPNDAILEAVLSPSVDESDESIPPLQRMELSQLALVAIVQAGDRSRALVEDSEMKGYILTEGTLIGKRGGRVSAIKDDRIEVTEPYKGLDDKVNERVLEIKLRTKEEQK